MNKNYFIILAPLLAMLPSLASLKDSDVAFFEDHWAKKLTLDTIKSRLPEVPSAAENLVKQWFSVPKNQQAYSLLTTLPDKLTNLLQQTEKDNREKTIKQHGFLVEDGVMRMPLNYEEDGVMPLNNEWHMRFSGITLRLYNLWQGHSEDGGGDRTKSLPYVIEKLNGKIFGKKTYQTLSQVVESHALIGLLKKYKHTDAVTVLPTYLCNVGSETSPCDENVVALQYVPQNLAFQSFLLSDMTTAWDKICKNIELSHVNALFDMSRYGGQWKAPRHLVGISQSAPYNNKLTVYSAEQPDNTAEKEILGNVTRHKFNTRVYVGLTNVIALAKESENPKVMQHVKSLLEKDPALQVQDHFGSLYKEEIMKLDASIKSATCNTQK